MHHIRRRSEQPGQALKRGPRLPLGQAGRPELQRADLRQPLRRRGRRGLHPHLVARPQAQRRLSRPSRDASPGPPGGACLPNSQRSARHAPRKRASGFASSLRLRVFPALRLCDYAPIRLCESRDASRAHGSNLSASHAALIALSLPSALAALAKRPLRRRERGPACLRRRCRRRRRSACPNMAWRPSGTPTC